MLMPERKFSVDGYRYGFNGKEKDSDMNGLTTYDYGFRIYNPAIGKFLSVDPLTKQFSELTPYQYSSNRPIDGIDLDGLEYLSFQRSMYRMQYGIRTEDIKMGNGSIQTVTSSNTVIKVIFENIPTALQDSKIGSFKYVSGGPVTDIGRDYTVAELSNVIFDRSRYFCSGPIFYGTASDGKSTNGINSLKGNASMQQQILAQNINGVGGALGPNGLGGMFSNWMNQDEWNGLTKEGDLRKAFYNATSLVDWYMGNNPTTGANSFNDRLKGGADRASLINFLTDGYLPTEHTDKFIGSENTSIRRNAYYKQLLVAWNGLQMMQTQGIEIREETKKSVFDLLDKYKADGGGTEFDNINQYMTTPKQ